MKIFTHRILFVPVLFVLSQAHAADIYVQSVRAPILSTSASANFCEPKAEVDRIGALTLCT